MRMNKKTIKMNQQTKLIILNFNKLLPLIIKIPKKNQLKNYFKIWSKLRLQLVNGLMLLIIRNFQLVIINNFNLIKKVL